MALDGKSVLFLSKKLGYNTQFLSEFSNAQIAKVIDIVRNRILNWALELESQGIRGTDWNFSQDEEDKAQNVQINNFYGDMGNVEVNQK